MHPIPRTFLPEQPSPLCLIFWRHLPTSVALDVESDMNTRSLCPQTAKTSKAPTWGYTDSQSVAQVTHRRAISEPVNYYYWHKPLPRLPHEIETYRSRSLPEPPSEPNRRNHRPLSKYTAKVPPYKDRALPSSPLQTSEPGVEDESAAETICMAESWSFFPYWSKILLLKGESVENWEEKLTFAREMQDCWAERKLFAHEVQYCARNCACGMV